MLLAGALGLAAARPSGIDQDEEASGNEVRLWANGDHAIRNLVQINESARKLGDSGCAQLDCSVSFMRKMQYVSFAR